MEVKIGVQSVPREIVIDTPMSADEVRQALADALSSDGFLEVSDEKGGHVMVPAAHLGYVEIGGAEPRRVGFNSF